MQKTSIKQRPIVRKKKAPLTPKQKLIKESAVQRERIERLVFVWQEKLFSQPKITTKVLERATLYLQPKTFEEVVEERNVQVWCGYPLCNKTPQKQLQKYKISLSQRKVFDQSELSSYCSENCFRKAKYYVMQLSEEPVWFRDLSQAPDVHIIDLDQDFENAIQEQRETRKSKTNEEIRQEYVQHLLGGASKKMDKDTLPIIEKDSVEPPTTPKVTSFDTLEGYKIEIKKDGKIPTSMVLKKKKEPERPVLQEVDPTNEDDLFNTMMMLKDMSLDKQEDTKSTPSTSNTQASTAESNNAEETIVDETKQTTAKQATQEPPKPKKKKKRVPELSLFGTIWTMLDHMTTKSTRLYLNELEKHSSRLDVMMLLQQENRMLNETMYLRGQILSERILETYHIIRAQIGIGGNMEDDIVNVIRTFRLSDASMIAPDPAQCYLLTLVIVKSLADITLNDATWKAPFEDCCKAIDQSLDTVDACVRVLKIASV